MEANYGLPKGSLWLGDIWLSLVLCNPQPSPSAWRPRCAEPASLQLNPTPLELCHSWFFNLTTIPSLVPITRRVCVQISCINNRGGPNYSGSTLERSTGKAFTVDVGGEGGGDCRAFVDRRTQCTEQAGSYWKINHKSSHLSDKERPLQSNISCVAGLSSSDRLLP